MGPFLFHNFLFFFFNHSFNAKSRHSDSGVFGNTDSELVIPDLFNSAVNTANRTDLIAFLQ